jgi:hypothetical protein
MAKKGNAHLRDLPFIYPDSLRPPPTLPDVESVLKTGLRLTEQELTVVRMAMAIHTTSKRPKLTWTGWRHIAVALAIGSDHARKASRGRLDTPDYRRVMSEFLRNTGFIFLNKDDRAAAVRLLPHWDEIDAWRSSLALSRQQALDNPRDTCAAYVSHRRELGDPEATSRPGVCHLHRPLPSLLEQMEALAEQREMANERAARAERESDYFAAMMRTVAERAELDEDDVAQIRAKVRAARAAENTPASDEQDQPG